MRLLVLESRLAADVRRIDDEEAGPEAASTAFEQFRPAWDEIEEIRATLEAELPYPPGDTSCLRHDEPVFGENNPPGPDEYLYHYTRTFTLPKIRRSRSLKFNPLKAMNDPHEAMDSHAFGTGLIGPAGSDLRLSTEETRRFAEADWIAEINNARRNAKVGSFSMDSVPDLADMDPEAAGRLVPRRLFAHRGFAHPRMWSQYADGNSGVCIVVHRGRLEAAVRAFVRGRWAWGCGAVDYAAAERDLSVGFYDARTMVRGGATEALIQNFEESILGKHADWAHEAEYRFFVMDGSEDAITVPIDESVVAGVLLGPQFDFQKHLRYVVPFARDFGIAGRVRHLTWTHGRPELTRVVVPAGARTPSPGIRSAHA